LTRTRTVEKVFPRLGERASTDEMLELIGQMPGLAGSSAVC